jgi:N-acetylglutamate synthase-like GNAT family acetyltransferase
MEVKALYEIRPLSNAYSNQAVALILPIQQIETGVAVTIEEQPDLFDIDRVYNQPGGGFWGALKDGELIGTIALISVGHSAGVIRKMFVKKEFRGRELAIAQQLFQTLLDHSQTKGIKDLYLGTVEKLKAACRFYERNGFNRINAEDLPSYFLRMQVDDTFYHLALSK